MTITRSFFATFPLLCLSLNCGTIEVETADAGSGDASGNVDGDGGDVDTTAPSISATSPLDGDVGVAEDSVIVVEFSEPMDEASVEGAWESSELPVEAVRFAWNTEGTTLTVSPNAALPLAEGEGLDPSTVSANTIAFRIDETAADLAGNRLETAIDTSFATEKRMRVDLIRSVELTRSMRADGLVFGANPVRFVVGDSSGNLQVKTFLSFETPVFPAGAVVESAVVSVNQNSIQNTPYDFGQMEIFHVNGSPIGEPIYTTALSRIGVFSATATTEIKSLDVVDAFRDDVANRGVRGDRTQYRLEFPTANDTDNAEDEARISRTSVAMEAIYLVD